VTLFFAFDCCEGWRCASQLAYLHRPALGGQTFSQKDVLSLRNISRSVFGGKNSNKKLWMFLDTFWTLFRATTTLTLLKRTKRSSLHWQMIHLLIFISSANLKTNPCKNQNPGKNQLSACSAIQAIEEED